MLGLCKEEPAADGVELYLFLHPPPGGDPGADAPDQTQPYQQLGVTEGSLLPVLPRSLWQPGGILASLGMEVGSIPHCAAPSFFSIGVLLSPSSAGSGISPGMRIQPSLCRALGDITMGVGCGNHKRFGCAHYPKPHFPCPRFPTPAPVCLYIHPGCAMGAGGRGAAPIGAG